jgi:uncharacterized transporter YbjL
MNSQGNLIVILLLVSALGFGILALRMDGIDQLFNSFAATGLLVSAILHHREKKRQK